MKIVLISGHDAQAARKTGFHFWKDILAARGCTVRFITVGTSLASFFKSKKKDLTPPFNIWHDIAPGVKKFTWLPLFHPFYIHKKYISALLAPLFRLYPMLLPRAILTDVSDADLFIIENGAGPMLAPALHRAGPNARFVYNASDRIGVIKFHPVVKEESMKALCHFDLIRLNAEKLADDFPPAAPVLYIPQGIDKSAFDNSHASPYKGPRNAVSVGDMLFDAATVKYLATRFPDWTFHLFGKKSILDKKFPNVREYGEVPFDSLIPYIRYADIGLAPYAEDEKASYLSQSSLKMVQYTYCRLPIVAPDFVREGRSHILAYRCGDDESVAKAFTSAIDFPRNQINVNAVRAWVDVIDDIIKATLMLPVRQI
jgi:2-beta-glucuronyltransferase